MKSKMFNFGDSGGSLFENFGSFGSSSGAGKIQESGEDDRTEEAAGARRAHRRTKECTEISQRYEYRRAFSEVRMLEAMRYVKLQDGCTYNFITGGDVDSLTYLKIVLLGAPFALFGFVAILIAWALKREDGVKGYGLEQRNMG